MITYTIGHKPVQEEKIAKRLSSVAYLKDYRLEQLGVDSYRILILPDKDQNIRALKGSVLDALVDVYGIKGQFDIDIITEDEELLPVVSDNRERIKYTEKEL